MLSTCSQPLPLHPSYLHLVRNIVEAFEALFHLGCEERGNQEWMVVVLVCETEITEHGWDAPCVLSKLTRYSDPAKEVAQRRAEVMERLDPRSYS